MSEPRQEFLIAMYGQMFPNINRHILIAWEIIPVVGGAIAAVTLAETDQLSVEFGAAVVILFSGRLACNALDSNEWVTRNLSILANIERQFLDKQDLTEIHYFFASMPENHVLRHLKIQLWFAGLLLTSAALWIAVAICQDGFSLSDLAPLVALVIVGLAWATVSSVYPR